MERALLGAGPERCLPFCVGSRVSAGLGCRSQSTGLLTVQGRNGKSQPGQAVRGQLTDSFALNGRDCVGRISGLAGQMRNEESLVNEWERFDRFQMRASGFGGGIEVSPQIENEDRG